MARVKITFNPGPLGPHLPPISSFTMCYLLSHTCSTVLLLEAPYHLSRSNNQRIASLKYSTSVSDDETDAHDGEDWTGNWDYSNGLESDSESKRPVVGMKRPVES